MSESVVLRTAFRVLKQPFFGKYMRPWRWPSAVDPAPYQRHVIERVRGFGLRVAVREAPQARGVVVLAHPMGLPAKGFWMRSGHVDLLVEAGFHAVAFDFNGFGESPSTDFDYPSDLIAVGRWAAERYPGLPLAALGASFGGMRVLEAMGDPSSPFRAVVSEAAAPTLLDYWGQYPPLGTFLRALTFVAPALERRLRPAAMLPHARPGTSLLVLHSDADTVTPARFGEAIARAVPAGVDVERVVLKGARHTLGLRDARAEYAEAVLGFLERTLGQAQRRSS